MEQLKKTCTPNSWLFFALNRPSKIGNVALKVLEKSLILMFEKGYELWLFLDALFLLTQWKSWLVRAACLTLRGIFRALRRLRLYARYSLGHFCW